MMILVVDSSVAAKWILPDEANDPGSARLLDDIRRKRVSVIVPELFRSEITSVVARSIRSGRLPSGSDEALSHLERMGILFANGAGISPNTVRVALEANHSPYDCCYLALALQLGCNLYTADRRFIRSVGAAYPCVKDIADYSSPSGDDR